MSSHRKTIPTVLTLWLLVVVTAWASAMRRIVVVPMSHGTVVAQPAEAAAGATVTLTALPAAGYRLRAASLSVEKVVSPAEADHADVAGAPGRVTMTDVGEYVTVTQRADGSFTFRMPDCDVEVRAVFEVDDIAGIDIRATDSGDLADEVDGVTIRVRRLGGDSVAIVEVVVPDSLAWRLLAIHIPDSVADDDGTPVAIVEIDSLALFGRVNITDIYLPATEAPLDIHDGAFLLDDLTGDAHHVARIHTPLWLLDDYALMASLAENYAAEKVQATATATHRYWTFACGVDVYLPDGVTPYTSTGDAAAAYLWEIRNAVVLKANNGVLLACVDDAGHQYEMVARPSDDRPSGMSPPTHNARTYAGNLLEPVVCPTHYDRSGYYILSNNEFHNILQEDATARVPACRAVLHLPDGHALPRILRVGVRATSLTAVVPDEIGPRSAVTLDGREAPPARSGLLIIDRRKVWIP